MNLSTATSCISLKGKRTHILATCDTSDDYIWRGHYAILTDWIPLTHSIIDYELSSKAVSKKLAELSDEKTFGTTILERARNSFEAEFYQKDEPLYMSVMLKAGGISYESEDGVSSLRRIAMSCDDKYFDIIHKFAGLTDSYSELAGPMQKLFHIRSSFNELALD